MKWDGFPTIQYVTNLRRISRNSTSLTALPVMHGTMRKITAANDYDKHEARFAATTMKYYSTTASSQPKVYYCLSPNLLVGFNHMQNSSKEFSSSVNHGFCGSLPGNHRAKHRKMADFDPSGSQNPEPIWMFGNWYSRNLSLHTYQSMCSKLFLFHFKHRVGWRRISVVRF